MSQFDMNQPQSTNCKICGDAHSIIMSCNYDRLIQIIHAQRKQIVQIAKQGQEILNTAREFQQVVIQMTPELERLIKVEEEYKALINGPKELQTEAPEQLAFSGV